MATVSLSRLSWDKPKRNLNPPARDNSLFSVALILCKARVNYYFSITLKKMSYFKLIFKIFTISTRIV